MYSKRRLSHAQGYLGLGMIAEAAAEIARIPSTEQDNPDVVAVRMAILQEQQQWQALRDLAARFVQSTPEEPAGWVTWAYATRRAESLEAAEKILLEAEKVHAGEPTIQFNLGCYACQRGDLAAARERVRKAIAIDAKFAACAATDPDLEPLRAANEDIGNGKAASE